MQIAGVTMMYVYFPLDITFPPDVTILHQGVFCLLSVFTGSVWKGVFIILFWGALFSVRPDGHPDWLQDSSTVRSRIPER